MSVKLSQDHKEAKRSQDDVSRFDLADDLKEGQDHKFVMQVKASSRSRSLLFKIKIKDYEQKSKTFREY